MASSDGIRPITREEYNAVARRGKAERRAIQQIPGVNQGVAFPCAWKHYENPRGWTCEGASYARRAGQSAGFRVETSCKDRTLYVLRVT